MNRSRNVKATMRKLETELFLDRKLLDKTVSYMVKSKNFSTALIFTDAEFQRKFWQNLVLVIIWTTHLNPRKSKTLNQLFDFTLTWKAEKLWKRRNLNRPRSPLIPRWLSRLNLNRRRWSSCNIFVKILISFLQQPVHLSVPAVEPPAPVPPMILSQDSMIASGPSKIRKFGVIKDPLQVFQDHKRRRT